MRVVLASASPRRRELLARICEFTAEPSLFEERARGLSARDTAAYFAEGKAKEVFRRLGGEIVVLGADTVVSLNGEILGKPKDEADAANTLRRLSGKTHSVFTGVCLVHGGGAKTLVSETRVTFETLSDELIRQYVGSGLPLDKAGSYGIQDGYPLVRNYEGSYTNVVGLPVEEVRSLLSEFGGTNAETCH